jgi:hypothetical protein
MAEAPEEHGSLPLAVKFYTAEKALLQLGLILERLSVSADGDLTPLRHVADRLAHREPEERLAAKHDLRTLLFPLEVRPASAAESAVILRRSQAFASHPAGQPAGRPAWGPGWPEAEGVPGYAVLCEIGRGGRGIVYKARDLALNRLVAIKTLPPGGSISLEERFRVEASALARLNHPNIVQVYGGREGDRPYLVQELVEGPSLRQVVGERGPLPAEEAARIAEDLAGALDYAHTRGVLHRDVKPANVLMTAEGTPKLVDFGLAKLPEFDPTITPPGTILGTPHYLAPEMLRGSDQADARTDPYGLGATLYYLLMGRPRRRCACTGWRRGRASEPTHCAAIASPASTWRRFVWPAPRWRIGWARRRCRASCWRRAGSWLGRCWRAGRAGCNG